MVMSDGAGPGAGQLEEEARRRKERLNSLKRKSHADPAGAGAGAAGGDKLALPRPKFRSYRPQDESLKEAVLGDAQPAAVEEEVKDLLEAANDKVVLEELDISSLAPRKPDWDLKRDVAKKLEKLERRTQKAIAELIWERLKQGEDGDIGAIVAMTDNRPAEDD